MKKLGVLFFALLLRAAGYAATENWTRIADAVIASPSNISSFRTSVFLIDTARVYVSTDLGNSWNVVAVLSSVSTYQLISFNNNFYAFSTKPGTFVDPNVTPCVYRSTDGVNWSQVSDFGVTNGAWRAATSFGGYLYAFNSSGGFLRSDGTGATLTWTSLPTPVYSGAGIFSFGQFQNYLYAFMLTSSTYRFVRSLDAVTWEMGYGSFATVAPQNYVFAANTTALYSGGSSLLSAFIVSTGGVVSPPAWSSATITNAVYPEPFIIGGTMHAGASNGIWKLGSDNEWEQTATIANGSGLTSATEIGDYAFVATHGDVFRQKIGASDANLQPYFPLPLSSGSQDGTVLSWVVESSMKEALTGLTVVNTGTARAGTDITRLRVLRYPSLTAVFELTAQSDGKTWIASGENYEWDDGDATFLLTADIANAPTDGATCLFQMTDKDCGINQSYVYNGDVVAPLAQEIRVAATASQITDIKYGPQPADTRVSFLTDVNGPSTIEIKLFDLNAHIITEIRNTTAASGRFSTDWDCSNVTADVYIAHIEINDNGNVRKYKKRVYVK